MFSLVSLISLIASHYWQGNILGCGACAALCCDAMVTSRFVVSPLKEGYRDLIFLQCYGGHGGVRVCAVPSALLAIGPSLLNDTLPGGASACANCVSRRTLLIGAFADNVNSMPAIVFFWYF